MTRCRSMLLLHRQANGPQDFHQFFHGRRFLEETRGLVFLRQPDFAGAPRSRKEEKWNGSDIAPGVQQFRAELKSVHFGHIDVANDQERDNRGGQEARQCAGRRRKRHHLVRKLQLSDKFLNKVEIFRIVIYYNYWPVTFVIFQVITVYVTQGKYINIGRNCGSIRPHPGLIRISDIPQQKTRRFAAG